MFVGSESTIKIELFTVGLTPVFVTVMVYLTIAPGIALGFTMPFIGSDITVSVFATVVTPFAEMGVLVMVQLITSPITGVSVKGTLVGKTVVELAFALVQALTALYCPKTVVPELASESV
jgi:hypothetical protein